MSSTVTINTLTANPHWLILEETTDHTMPLPCTGSYPLMRIKTTLPCPCYDECSSYLVGEGQSAVDVQTVIALQLKKRVAQEFLPGPKERERERGGNRDRGGG